jgi:hypothetical protein
VNAAFLLMTTAWIAGADAAAPTAPPAKPAAAPVYSVGTGGCAGGGCTGCDACGCESEGFFSKLKARFHHGSDCGCDSGCGSEGVFSKMKGHTHKSDCGCDSGCGGCGSPCDSGGHSGGGLREKLRGLFNKHGSSDCGCDCGGCTSGYGTPVPHGGMKPEPLGTPKEELKKLPSGDIKNPEKKPGSVQLIPQPVDAPHLDIAPTSGKSPF